MNSCTYNPLMLTFASKIDGGGITPRNSLTYTPNTTSSRTRQGDGDSSSQNRLQCNIHLPFHIMRLHGNERTAFRHWGIRTCILGALSPQNRAWGFNRKKKGRQNGAGDRLASLSTFPMVSGGVLLWALVLLLAGGWRAGRIG